MNLRRISGKTWKNLLTNLYICVRIQIQDNRTEVFPIEIEKIHLERNLQNRVYEVIKNYLIRPDVLPGARLYEEKLAEEIGVSRTPVKMGLNRLEHEGLVRIDYNKGAFKAHLSLKEVVEIIKIRKTLECLSLEMINEFEPEIVDDLGKSIPESSSFAKPEDISKYPEFDQKFHEKMIQIGKSKWLYRLIKNQDGVFHMIRFIALDSVEKIKDSIEGHKKIFEALKTNNIPLAISYTHDNYGSSIRAIEQKSMKYPGLFL